MTKAHRSESKASIDYLCGSYTNLKNPAKWTSQTLQIQYLTLEIKHIQLTLVTKT